MRISWPEFAFFKVSSASNPNRPTETVSNSKLEPPAKQSVRLWRLDSLYYLFLAVKKFPPPSTFTLTPCKSAILYTSTNLVQFFPCKSSLWRSLLDSERTRAVYFLRIKSIYLGISLSPNTFLSRKRGLSTV